MPGYEGPATLETATVMHERDGSRGRAHAAVRTATGARAWAVTTDPSVTAALESSDLVTARVTIGPDAVLHLD